MRRLIIGSLQCSFCVVRRLYGVQPGGKQGTWQRRCLCCVVGQYWQLGLSVATLAITSYALYVQQILPLSRNVMHIE